MLHSYRDNQKSMVTNLTLVSDWCSTVFYANIEHADGGEIVSS